MEKFPKSYRFSIGQSLVTASIELLMDLVDATYQVRNAGSLAAAVREVNRIRYLVRLAKDLRVINLDEEAEQVMMSSPVELDYQIIEGEELSLSASPALADF